MTDGDLANNEIKKLYRSRENRILFGVCGGLSKYFDIDVVIVRMVFLFLIFVDGVGLVTYLAFTLLTPLEPGIDEKTGNEEIKDLVGGIKKNRARKLLGFVAIFIGLKIILRPYLPTMFVSWFDWGNIWPYIIVLFGFYLVFKNNKIK